MKALDVIAGKNKWSADCSDAIQWLRALPDDSVDLLFTSPPYELARTYGIADKMKGGQAWIDWMVSVVTAAAPKVKGLIAINCEGQTRGYRYSCVPFLFMADLHRAGFNLRKPPVFHRVGIPGSGGPDWLRNDYEPIVCVTRKGKLPWSDNTAEGHEPKWMAGGPMSYRNTNGARRNAHGVMTDKPVGTRAYGDKGKYGADRETYRAKSKRQQARDAGVQLRTTTSGSRNGDIETQGTYLAPAKANPGNVLTFHVGGSKMGHPIAHESEAPFPLELPAFFVKSFCPPDGIVADPFAGSFMTIHAAIDAGRRGIGCDIRESQIRLGERRMATVTAALFAS